MRSTGLVRLGVAFVVILRLAIAMIQIPLIPYHAMILKKHRSLQRRRHKEKLMQQIDALYQGWGTHYIDLWVGTPKPQRQTVVVSTGSGFTAFPCSNCTDCGKMFHTDSYFVEVDSSTFKKVSCSNCTVGTCSQHSESECRMNYSYAEGSTWSAYESRDVTFAGGPHDKPSVEDAFSQHTEDPEDDLDPNRAKNFGFDLTFGCMTHSTGLFRKQLANGIIGMDHGETAFWHQAWKKGVIARRSFSLCLSHQPIVSLKGTEAGALTMGGVDERLHQSPMVYSTFESNTFFSANVKKIYLREGGGTSALANSPNLEVLSLEIEEIGNVDIDSGTSATYFTNKIAEAFNEAWEKLSGKAYSHDSMKLADDELDNLPTILFQLDGDTGMNKKLLDDDEDASKVVGLAVLLDPNNPLDVVVAMPPRHYMEYERGSKSYIPRFYVDKSGSDSTFGANLMMAHDITFDVDNNRIGWAESHCDYTKLEEEFEDKAKAIITEESKVPNTNVQDEEENSTAKSESAFPLVSFLFAMLGVVAIVVVGMVTMTWKKIAFYHTRLFYYQTPTPELEIPQLSIYDEDDDIIAFA